ncbi:histidine--tRNA ligase [Tenuifilum sp.]|uniref:histidine--tRNA ligase n=1 Tax=Tenuifilum sp. TaxID=2760880 RepID=UPI001B6B333D|nr:histidine--tRNA ligase [Bacteroidales bacterium]HOK87011.1 histidine--tRNA ligase [Tenuifilum sp.]HON71573.1 histidine--tRNA ligase [Tenuifilum sp.]HOU74977.1 histidine--tRNA ligase [Tenuifilum sp.]HPP91172.1 histidine--tRNA ligase [Tenuifilum sp.]
MAKTKPSIPKGTRDFGPDQMVRRNYIFDTIRTVFSKYGYSPIETPAMENLSTLLGKYGDEGDKLLFKILNSGDFIDKVEPSLLKPGNSNAASLAICEKGLRYDLTVPFARFVVQYQNEITFPFKRYQIQPVWRADRPQKGRYREFYQCDVDVIGSNSLLNEAELVLIINEVFGKLNVRTLLKVNNRKILSGIAEVIGHADKLVDITVAIDKIEKIGIDAVNAELRERGIDEVAIQKLQPIIQLQGSNAQKLSTLRNVLQGSPIGQKGIDEMEELFRYIEAWGSLSTQVELDLSLARGLNYYTGAIFEVKAQDAEIGSICGGGRYDDLTGIFGLPNVSGVGVSFGADRIYDVMQQLNLFPESLTSTTQVMFANFGTTEVAYCMPAARKLRDAGISVEIYPDAAKVKKQFEYANKRNIRFVVIAGETEIQNRQFSVKNMATGNQVTIPFDGIEEHIKLNL